MHVHIETDIAAPAQQVWQILAHQFARVDQWSSTVTASHPVSRDELPHGHIADPRAPIAGRKTTSAFATLREYFTEFDDAGMTFTFATLDTPFFLTEATNRSRVVATGPGKARVIFDVEMKMWGPFSLAAGLMKARFTRAMQAVHGDLKVYAERTVAKRTAA